MKRLLVVVILWQAMSASSHGIMRPDELTAGAAHTVVSEPSTGLRQPEIELTTAQRLLTFKKMLPECRRVLVFYSPSSPGAHIIAAREAAERLDIKLLERPVRTVEQLKAALDRMDKGDMDGIFHIPDAWATGHADLILRVARTKRIPTMTFGQMYVAKGALAALFYPQGTHDRRYYLVINLKAAKQMGLTIPQKVLLRADEVVTSEGTVLTRVGRPQERIKKRGN